MKILSGFAAALAALVLSACGGGGSDSVMAAASDTVLAASPTTTAAVTGTTFSFPSGVAELGTSTATTVTFSKNPADASKPLFTITTDSGTATGTTAFGSCIFAVTSTTGTVPAGLRVGQTVTVHPCNLSVATAGAVANGVATSRSIALVLGAAASANATITVGVNPGGGLTLNGNLVGTITLVPVTG